MKHIPTREFRNHLAEYLNSAEPLVITNNGEPIALVVRPDFIEQLVQKYQLKDG